MLNRNWAILLLLFAIGCGGVEFIPPEPEGKYKITMSNGWASSAGYCDSYKIDGNRVTLFDANGNVKGEAVINEGFALAIDRVY